MPRSASRPTTNQIQNYLEPIRRAAEVRRSTQAHYRDSILTAYAAGIQPSYIAQYAGVRRPTILMIIKRAKVREQSAGTPSPAPVNERRTPRRSP